MRLPFESLCLHLTEVCKIVWIKIDDMESLFTLGLQKGLIGPY